MQNLSEGAVQAGVVIDLVRQLESTLKARGATGKGLHEKVSSIETALPADLVAKLRFIASVRNKIVHEDELLSDEDLAAFVEAGKEAVDDLGGLPSPGKKAAKKSSGKTGKTRKPAPGPVPASSSQSLAQARAVLGLGGALLTAGIILVFFLMLLGNDGYALWLGAFSIFFLLGRYFLARLRHRAPAA